MFPDNTRLYPRGARLLATGDKGGFNWPHPNERGLLANGVTVPVRVLDNDEVLAHGGYVVMVTTSGGGTYTTWIGYDDLIPSHEPVDVHDTDISALVCQATLVLDEAGIKDREQFDSLLRESSVESLLSAIVLVLNQVRTAPGAPPMSQWRDLDGLWSKTAQMVDAALLLQNSWYIAGTAECPVDTQEKVAESLRRVMADLVVG